MKTTKIFMMAALALMTVACSNDDEFAQQPAEQPTNNEITITAQLAPKSGEMTRAVADGGVATWAVDEELAILFNDGVNDLKRVATVTSVSAGVATIEFTIPGTLADNTACTLVYPASAANADNTDVKAYADLFTMQNGALDYTLDVRKGAGTIQTGTPGLTVTTVLTPQFSIFKFTVQNLSSNAKTPTEFKITDGPGNWITLVTPSASTFYVALPELAVGTYWFYATIEGKPYIAKPNIGTATTAGNFYSTTVKMATIGNVIGENGKFYANASAASAASTTARAIITYLGNETGEGFDGTHGLALATSDANNGNYCCWSTEYTDAGHSKQISTPFGSESGLQYRDATHNSDNYPAFKAAFENNNKTKPADCSDWFLPSGFQWEQMITAAGGYENLKTNVNLTSNQYWTSTEYDTDHAWKYNANNGVIDTYSKKNNYLVRSAVAF